MIIREVLPPSGKNPFDFSHCSGAARRELCQFSRALPLPLKKTAGPILLWTPASLLIMWGPVSCASGRKQIELASGHRFGKRNA